MGRFDVRDAGSVARNRRSFAGAAAALTVSGCFRGRKPLWSLARVGPGSARSADQRSVYSPRLADLWFTDAHAGPGT